MSSGHNTRHPNQPNINSTHGNQTSNNDNDKPTHQEMNNASTLVRSLDTRIHTGVHQDPQEYPPPAEAPGSLGAPRRQKVLRAGTFAEFAPPRERIIRRRARLRRHPPRPTRSSAASTHRCRLDSRSSSTIITSNKRVRQVPRLHALWVTYTAGAATAATAAAVAAAATVVAPRRGAEVVGICTRCNRHTQIRGRAAVRSAIQTIARVGMRRATGCGATAGG